MAWVVADCHLARKVLNDPYFSKRRLRDDGATHPLYRHMLTLDPPEHTRLRAFVAGYFLPGRIRQLREPIESIARPFAALRGRDKVDLVSAFAKPLALQTICALAGIPRLDAPLVENWSQRLVRADFEDSSQFPVIAGEMCGYFQELLERTRPDPAGPIFAHLADAVERGTLDSQEMFAMTFLLLNAGYETSANLISSGVLTLLRNPRSGRLSATSPRSRPGPSRSCCASKARCRCPLPAMPRRMWFSAVRRFGQAIWSSWLWGPPTAMPRSFPSPTAWTCARQCRPAYGLRTWRALLHRRAARQARRGDRDRRLRRKNPRRATTNLDRPPGSGLLSCAVCQRCIWARMRKSIVGYTDRLSVARATGRNS